MLLRNSKVIISQCNPPEFWICDCLEWHQRTSHILAWSWTHNTSICRFTDYPLCSICYITCSICGGLVCISHTDALSIWTYVTSHYAVSREMMAQVWPTDLDQVQYCSRGQSIYIGGAFEVDLLSVWALFILYWLFSALNPKEVYFDHAWPSFIFAVKRQWTTSILLPSFTMHHFFQGLFSTSRAVTGNITVRLIPI